MVTGASEQAPAHQEGGSSHVWQYPSEQMFFNAMKRKGWDAKEEDMHSVVAIHNSVNERAWQQVLQYEVRCYYKSKNIVQKIISEVNPPCPDTEVS